MSTISTTPFVFNGDYYNHEQVRYLQPEFEAVREELVWKGRYPYNDDFRGRIRSLATTDRKNEDTAIYLLQTLHTLDEEAAKEAEFLASGGREVTFDEVMASGVLRGTIVHRNFYSGGTGWVEYSGSRLTTYGSHMMVLPKNKRTNGFLLYGRVLIREGK